VLAAVVPATVLVAVAILDPLSAVLMLATLPLVPVVMWLVGRYTEDRTAERWQALRLLSVQLPPTRRSSVLCALRSSRTGMRAAGRARHAGRRAGTQPLGRPAPARRCGAGPARRHPVLVLDEPTAHLDVATADRMLHDLFAATEGRSILLITHRPEDRLLVDEIVDLGGCCS
jgi:ABC-type transport system involved in cytochrome bd biosynthesis fused ATPase/permease subunit